MRIHVKSLSYSTVREYCEGCPEKVFLDKIDHKPRKGIPANMLFGTCFHAAAEAFFRGLFLNHRFKADTLFRVFQVKWNQAPQDEVLYSKKEKDELFQKAQELIQLLADSEAPHQILAIEQPVEIPVTEDLTIIGKPDVMYRDKQGRLTIADIKTSAKSYGQDDILKATSQTYTYARAFQEPVRLKLLLFVKTKTAKMEEIDLNPDDIDFTEWKNRFVMTKKAIEHGIRYRVRGWQCNGCSFAYICNNQIDSNEYQLVA